MSDITFNCEIMLTMSKFGTLPIAVLDIIILGELATLTIMTSMMTPTAFEQPTQQQQRQSTIIVTGNSSIIVFFFFFRILISKHIEVKVLPVTAIAVSQSIRSFL